MFDLKKVLVDGPGVSRKALNLKTLYLTKFKLNIPHSAREATVKKAWAKAEIDKKWAESQWAKRLAAKKIRSSLTDFDRFRLMRAKQTVVFIYIRSFFRPSRSSGFVCFLREIV